MGSHHKPPKLSIHWLFIILHKVRLVFAIMALPPTWTAWVYFYRQYWWGPNEMPGLLEEFQQRMPYVEEWKQEVTRAWYYYEITLLTTREKKKVHKELKRWQEEDPRFCLWGIAEEEEEEVETDLSFETSTRSESETQLLSLSQRHE